MIWVVLERTNVPYLLHIDSLFLWEEEVGVKIKFVLSGKIFLAKLSYLNILIANNLGFLN